MDIKVKVLGQASMPINYARRIALEQIGKSTAQLLMRNISDQETTGGSLRSIGHRGDGKNMYILGYSHVPIASEYGRQAGTMPPISALKKWAKIKLGNEKLAYAVAKSITKKGTRQYRNGGNPPRISNTIQSINDKILPTVIDNFLKAIL